MKYPIGIQNFEKLRSEVCAYVGKTPRQLLIFMVLIALFFPLDLWAKLNLGDVFTADGIDYKVISLDPMQVQFGARDDNNPVVDKSITGSFNIPSTVIGSDGNSYSVKTISHYAFYGCTGLSSVSIPNSVTTISSAAFEGCSGLNSITIPNGVVSIYNHAFAGCGSLTSVTIPNSVTYLGRYAFYGCSSLISVILPNNMTSIEMGTFFDCSSLTSVTIPNTVTSIGDNAFTDCSSLSTVTIPEGVTSIGNQAFLNCSSLTSFTFPSKVTSIGETTFYGCNGFTSMDIPYGITTIGEGAFFNCEGLVSVTIPSSVTSIDRFAFAYCTKLTSVTVNIQEPIAIDDEAFLATTDATLYVPKESVEAYKADDHWKGFKEILPISTNDAGTAKAKVMVVTTMDGKKTKLGLKNEPNITIETPYLVYKSDVAEARFELDQLRDIKYEDVTPILGDASGDGVINRADVDETVQYIFGKPSGDFIFSNADTNHDQKVNAADIVQISDLVKNPNINDISKSRSAANSDDQATYSQQHQYAIYNYRNDNDFNAFLNVDIDKIIYSNIGLDGTEYKNAVVQEVWTPDSVYRIPIQAIDSIGFRAPEPIMREGIFYLTEYHAAHTLEIDSLTLYFDTSIDRDRLPSLGQVVLHNTFTTPYEEGFAGKVKTIEKVNGRIKIDCEMLCVGDVYKHLVLVGSAKTMTDEEADVASARTRGDGDPWKKYEENGEMPIRKIGDLTFNIFDGLISVVSKDPTLQVKYMVYVDEDIFHISANCQLTHNDLQYGVNLSYNKLSEIDDTIKVDKELKEITQALKRLQNYKEMSAEEWAKSILDEKKQKGDKEKLSDDEATVLGRLWDKLHGSWTIPIGGPFVLDLELGPLFKPKGSLELSFMAKTKARNTFYVEARGYTMATLANPKLALATGLAHIDGYSNFHSDPISSLSVSAKAKASLSMGIIGKVSISLIHKSIVHATVSGQGGLKLGGTFEAKWDSESWYDEDYSFNNFKDYFDPLYDTLKDTKVKAELFANFGVELGLTPWSFLSVGAEWEVYNNELGSCYPFPHFSKPSFPVYYHDKEQWSNGNFNNHLVLQSLPTKNIPDLLLGPCKIGMRIIDEEGKTVRETEDREYRDDGTIVWQLFPLEIDLKGLETGKNYRCYPVLHYHDWYKLRATPSYEFTVPEPVSVKQSSLNIKKGDTKDITVSGGWGCYEIINDKSNIVTAFFSDEGEVTNSGDSNNMSGPGGGGGSDWGPPLIWTSSWPTDEIPTLQIKGIDVGEATVQVKDMRSNETTSIKVVVTDEEITPLKVEPQDIDFGTMTKGSSKTDYFIIYNTGKDNLIFHLDYSTLDGVFNVLEGGEETVLKPGESKKYTVTCTIPKDYEYYGGGVAIYVRSNAHNDDSIMVGVGVNVIHEEN